MLIRIIDDVVSLFYPETCITCGTAVEMPGQLFCFYCLSDLPLTGFSFMPKNRLETSFRGRIPIKGATALLYFHKKGPVQKMMHRLKYQGQQHIGTFIGDWLGEEMLQAKRFEGIDLILPVPLHAAKQRKRGYNQVFRFAQSLSVKLCKPMSTDLLVKISDSVSQTSKARNERVLEKGSGFRLLDTLPLQDKHVLLVDDIITSGATLEGCWSQLQKVKGLEISLACMAFTA